MKNSHTYAVLFSLALAPLAALAQSNETPIRMAPMTVTKTAEQLYLDSFDRTLGLAYPVSLVAPSIGTTGAYAGNKVELVFTIEANGQPSHVRATPNSSGDLRFITLVTNAVAGWRFQAAVKDGKPAASEVTLEVRVTGAQTPTLGYGSMKVVDAKPAATASTR